MPDTAMSIAAVNQLPGVPIDKVNGEGECPTRRRVPPQLIQSTGVPIDKVNGVEYPTF